MSAVELRKAAKTLRERANAADAPPWEQTGKSGSPWNDLVVTDASNGITAHCDTSDENALYIATMHPGVGMALAEHLEEFADFLDSFGPGYADRITPQGTDTLARLINGGTS